MAAGHGVVDARSRQVTCASSSMWGRRNNPVSAAAHSRQPAEIRSSSALETPASRARSVGAPPTSSASWGKGRGEGPVGPEPAPPPSVIGRGIAPGRGGEPRVLQSGRGSPGGEPASGIGLTAGGTGEPQIELEPAVEGGHAGMPEEAAVVAVAGSDIASRPGDAGHLAQRGHGIGQVLEHLMGVDDVEAVVGIGESVDVGDLADDRRRSPLGRLAPRQPDGRLVGLDGDHLGHVFGEVAGDGARSGADIQQAMPGSEHREQIGRRVLRRAAPMRAQHGFGMSVQISVGLSSRGLVAHVLTVAPLTSAWSSRGARRAR